MKFLILNLLIISILLHIVKTSIHDSETGSTLSSFTISSSTDSNSQTATMTTRAPESNKMLDTITQEVWKKFNGVGDILDQAAQATASLGQSGSLAKLQEMKNEMTQIGGALENLNFNNISEVATGLESVGKKLLGVSGNATEVKQQLLNAAVKALTDGTLCKSPAEIAASVAQGAMEIVSRNLPSFLAKLAEEKGTPGIEGLASAAAMVGTVAKAAEGAGALSQGIGVALGVAKCVKTFGSWVGIFAAGGPLSPLLLLFG